MNIIHSLVKIPIDDDSEDIGELLDLIKLDQKFMSVISDGILPVDSMSIKHRVMRLNRIEEISCKYGLPKYKNGAKITQLMSCL